MRNLPPFILFIFLINTVCFAKPRKEQIVEIKTTYGNIYVWLYKETPLHRANFLKLVKEGFYNNTIFHRVIKDFMIQGGDPYSRMEEKKDSIGHGGPGYTIEAEIKPQFFHKRGVLAAARMPDNVNPQRRSSGSQFYIMQGRKFSDDELKNIERSIGLSIKDPNFKFTDEQLAVYKEIGGAPWLDRQYTIFGEVISGMDVVDKIASVEKIPVDRPKEDIKINMKIINISLKNLKKKYNYQPVK
jgi:peptidyl-prolyl cis-trans isomerase B (cyclophilin B)